MTPTIYIPDQLKHAVAEYLDGAVDVDVSTRYRTTVVRVDGRNGTPETLTVSWDRWDDLSHYEGVEAAWDQITTDVDATVAAFRAGKRQCTVTDGGDN